MTEEEQAAVLAALQEDPTSFEWYPDCGTVRLIEWRTHIPRFRVAEIIQGFIENGFLEWTGQIANHDLYRLTKKGKSDDQAQ